ncbi:RDD family protein [Roseivirga pacifica]|uniref:RDD family protein n=1 Tax=Roseivirga pacifica TaxID=1267423 RepID=UPI003BA90C21
MTDKKVSLGLRLGTMFLDHFIMCFIIVPPLIVMSLIVKSEPFETKPIETFAFYLMMLLYLNKDFIEGKSLSKRILGLKVVDRKTGESASELKCFLRNMTIPVWPLEVFVSLFSTNRRLGDLIANTKVEVSEKEHATSILQDLKKKRLTQTSLWTLVAGIIYMGGLWYLMDRLIGI